MLGRNTHGSEAEFFLVQQNGGGMLLVSFSPGEVNFDHLVKEAFVLYYAFNMNCPPMLIYWMVGPQMVVPTSGDMVCLEIYHAGGMALKFTLHYWALPVYLLPMKYELDSLSLYMILLSWCSGLLQIKAMRPAHHRLKFWNHKGLNYFSTATIKHHDQGNS